MTYIELFGGLIYLLMGGDLLVRGAVALARRARVSPVLVALSVVSFGTSLPELVISVRAALTGYPGIAVGNVVGSNIANVLLVCALPAMAYPLTVTHGTERRDASGLVVASVLFFAVCLPGALTRLSGVLLLTTLAAFAGYAARAVSRAQRVGGSAPPVEWALGVPTKPAMIALFIAAGLVGLPIGAGFVVDSSVRIAEQLGVSDAVVGLTIIAVGTSLPELATTVVAAFQRQTEVVLGTAIGSSIFNVLGIMGVAAIVSPAPIPVPDGFISLDLPVMLAGALVLVGFAWRGRAIGRRAGLFLLIGYLSYLVRLVIRG